MFLNKDVETLTTSSLCLGSVCDFQLKIRPKRFETLDVCPTTSVVREDLHAVRL